MTFVSICVSWQPSDTSTSRCALNSSDFTIEECLLTVVFSFFNGYPSFLRFLLFLPYLPETIVSNRRENFMRHGRIAETTPWRSADRTLTLFPSLSFLVNVLAQFPIPTSLPSFFSYFPCYIIHRSSFEIT